MASASKQTIDHIIPYLEDKILASGEYSQLLDMSRRELKSCVFATLDQMPHTVGDRSINHLSMDASHATFSGASVTTVDSSVMSFSTTGGTVQVEDLHEINHLLMRFQNFPVRQGAIQRLAAWSIGDLVADEFWPVTRRALECAILDNDIRKYLSNAVY